MLQKTQTCRRCICARAVPKLPVLAPMIAIGFPFRGGSGGREAQSMAFFRTPGIEKFYSGVAISNASAAAMRSRNC